MQNDQARTMSDERKQASQSLTEHGTDSNQEQLQPLNNDNSDSLPENQQDQTSQWSLVLSATIWSLTNLIFIAVPFLILNSLYKQYLELITNADRTSRAITILTQLDQIEELHPYMQYVQNAIISTIQQAPTQIPIEIKIAIITTSIISFLIIAAPTVIIATSISKGKNWGRHTALILSTASASLIVIPLWITIDQLSWIPIKAIKLNSLGITITAMYIISIILAYIPPSNKHVRKTKETRKKVRQR